MKKMCVQLDEREIQDNPFRPDLWRIVRHYPLTSDVNFYQTRPVDNDEALRLDYIPGQFVMMSIPGEGEAPFCISSTPSRPGMLEFCIRNMGTLTSTLFSIKENQTVGIRGPYGNGFPIDKMEGKDILIVAGGMGSAPLRSLLLYVLDNRDRFGRLIYLHGAKNEGEMLFKEEFIQLKQREDVEMLMSVDKDEAGTWPYKVGLVTTLFKDLGKIDATNTYAAVCGPPVMYKFVIADLKARKVPDDHIILSLERRMKCGVGKCGHCQINQIYVCKDGPVFNYSKIRGVPEAL